VTELPAEQEEAPPVASITVTFMAGSLSMGITSTGEVGQSHLWAASALLDRIATQLWADGQALARQQAAAERAATQSVLRDLKLPGRRS